MYDIQKNGITDMAAETAISLMLFLAFGIFICFGKDESISCSNRNIKCNGGIYHNGNMLGEP